MMPGPEGGKFVQEEDVHIHVLPDAAVICTEFDHCCSLSRITGTVESTRAALSRLPFHLVLHTHQDLSIKTNVCQQNTT